MRWDLIKIAWIILTINRTILIREGTKLERWITVFIQALNSPAGKGKFLVDS
jgi:hypothetical protein